MAKGQEVAEEEVFFFEDPDDGEIFKATLKQLQEEFANYGWDIPKVKVWRVEPIPYKITLGVEKGDKNA
jgi:hypothetical protein